jgi:hypothetical protein
MGIFFEYLKLHLKAWLLWIVFSAVFAVVFSLYHLPLAAVFYGVAVCFFIGIVALIFDFSKFLKKHRTLCRILEEESFTSDNIPFADNIIESDLNNIISKLLEDKISFQNRLSDKYSDMIDYYTLWAHQIKTPISAMSLSLQNSHSPESSSLSEELKRIEQYVDMVLCYLRLDSDSTDFVIKHYDLDTIVRQAVKKFSTQFINRKIGLKYDSLNCLVLTDEKWLLFVIEQVLSNALKYTRTGTIEITLAEPKTLVISDTGIGISPEDIPRIFEKGYTGYNGRSDKKASGIGLYLCKRICTKLGHKIYVRSEVGVGTSVMIDLAENSIGIE